jgi:hypothetical protein
MTFFVAAAVTIGVSTVYSATQQRKAGKRQAEELMRQREEENLKAKTEELGRMQELSDNLAASNLAMANSGISGMTPQSVALNNAKTISDSESMIGLSNRLLSAQRQRQAINARKTANAQAVGTLLGGAANIATLGASQPKTPIG